jgi:lysozyme family protein
MTDERLISDDWIVDQILEWEGRGLFTDRPDDAGGATRWGITQETLAAWRLRPVTAQEVAQLTEFEARQIYGHRYLATSGFGRVQNRHLRWLLADCGVLHGPARAVRWLQSALGVTVDGKLGPQTAGALWAADWRIVFLDLCRRRINFIGEIVSGDLKDRDRDGVPDHTEMCKGWLWRATSFLKEAA